MNQTKQNAHESEEANQKLGEKFKGYNPGTLAAADSEIARTNQKLQQEFYENDENNNFLPFHIDSASPPIKK